MARKNKVNKDIEHYDPAEKKRLNNPPVGLVSQNTEPYEDTRKTYEYEPRLDTQLQWGGKAEHTSFEVPGFDYYNPKARNVDSGGKGNIAIPHLRATLEVASKKTRFKNEKMDT